MSLLEKLKPTDFQTKEHYWGTFGNSETEVSACWIIMFLQHRMSQGEVAQNGWAPFTYEELDNFYNDTRMARGKARENFWFNRLIGNFASAPVLIAGDRLHPSAVVTITEHFVSKLASQPKMLL
jgi:hypothetical protein